MSKVKECPFCGSRKYKTLSGGIPRCCLKRAKKDGIVSDSFKRDHAVSTIRGKWYPRKPFLTLIAEFVSQMKKPKQWGQYYKLTKGSSEYRAVYPAALKLLEECQWDTDLAREVIRIFFGGLNKPCPTFWWIVSSRNLPTNLAKARKSLKKKRDKQEQQRAAIEESGRNRGYMDEVYASLETM